MRNMFLADPSHVSHVLRILIPILVKNVETKKLMLLRPSAWDLCTGGRHGLWELAQCGSAAHPDQPRGCGPAL